MRRFEKAGLAARCLMAADLLREERPCMNPRSILFPPWPEERRRSQKTARTREREKTVEVIRGDR